jgi:hypothetical protein
VRVGGGGTLSVLLREFNCLLVVGWVLWVACGRLKLDLKRMVAWSYDLG